MMKYFTLVIAALLLCSVSSCHKDGSPGPASTSIVGRWRWVKSIGGIAGTTVTPANNGYNLTHVYGANGTFELYKNDSLELQSKYSIIRNFKYETQTIDLLKIDNNESNRADFTIGNDTLYTSNTLFMSDGFSSVYVRIK
jgi:hypothetical protein